MNTYTIDTARSRVAFTVRHLGFSKVSGSFKEIRGTIRFDGQELHSLAAEANITVGSIDTGDLDRDDNLRSKEFFAADGYPEIAFVSTSVADVSRDRFTLVGDLTIRGVTRSVALKARFRGDVAGSESGSRIGFTASLVINRKDYGLRWNAAIEAGGLVVSEDVRITLEVEAVSGEDGSR